VEDPLPPSTPPPEPPSESEHPNSPALEKTHPEAMLTPAADSRALVTAVESSTAAERSPEIPALADLSPETVPLSPEPPSYKDRGTGLTIFGVFQIVLGLFAALMIPFAALGAFMSRFAPGGGTMRPIQMLSGMGTYAFLAAALITLGVGSIRMKRWAHALTVVTSWYWLVSGILITILMTAVMPVTMRSALAHAQQTTPNAGSTEFATGFMAVIVTIMIVFMAFFLIAVPIAFLVFYSRDDVYQTCRFRDPVERWTDRAPLPVLGASVVLFVGSLYMLSVGLTMPIFPFFGRYLTGLAGAACFLTLAVIDICLAVGIFRLRSLAWWLAVVISPIRLVSMILTYSKADSMQAYAKLGWSDAQMEMMNSNPMFRNHIILWWSLVSVFVFFGYLVWLKRYFKPSAAVESGALPAQAS
jgi:hypothetical protein